jgi:UDP-2-acetamido-2-deoxy-ribo-hexuluronate aminotransferase
MKPIQMVDLNGQYQKIKKEVLAEIEGVIDSSSFINGPIVKTFSKNLESFLQVNHVIPCANGTDALQIALMALNLKSGDEVIIPSFNYVALAEVTALLGLKPVFVDVHPEFFTIDPLKIEEKITAKTKVIAPVHLFGQSAPMEEIMKIAKKHNLFVVEDNAQAIGATYTFSDGSQKYAGTIGHIGTTSFFPSKNLGCFGDGGAVFTQDETLGNTLKMIANHGQKVKYIHDVVGVNSRLDSIQAAILNVKLRYLNEYNLARKKVADFYSSNFQNLKDIISTPKLAPYSTHVFHQYTLKIKPELRDALRESLNANGVPSMIYYPIALHKQKAYETSDTIPISEGLASSVISLPISTEMDLEQLNHIVNSVNDFFSTSRA